MSNRSHADDGIEEPTMLSDGIALWFGCNDADALHTQLVEHGTSIVFPPKDGAFGRTPLSCRRAA